MSKNTGTSELINYFDLGANGDVGIAGSLDINTIANATTDTDKFLVSDTGIIKFRTGAELLSDIGAAPATGGGYLPLTGGILTGTTRMDGSGGTVPSITMIFNSGVNRLLAPLLRLYGATNESSNYIELFGSLATSNRTINFPDASGTVALTSNLAGYLPLTGGTLTGALGGTTANFSSNVTIGGNDSIATRLYVRTESTANTPSLTLFKNITSASSEDIFRVQSWNGAFNTVASIKANGSANFLSSVSATSIRSSAVGSFGFNTANNGEFQIYATAESGLVMAGRGATYDMVITNKNGADTIRIPTGTINVNFVGNVGVGTASPGNFSGLSFAGPFLDVTGFMQIKGTAANTVAAIQFGGDTFRKGLIYSSIGTEDPYLAFGTASSGNNSSAFERMRITSGGNVLIGTTSDSGSRLRVSGGSLQISSGNLQIDSGFQRMFTYAIGVNPGTTGTITISSPIGTNMQGSMHVMAGGYGNGLTGNITGLWIVGGLLFFDNAGTSTITQIVNSVTNFGSMSFQRSGDQYTVSLTNTASSGGSTKSLYVSVIINGT